MSQEPKSGYWRVRWAGIGAAIALALVGLAWLLTSVVKSPQDALAEAAPPPPSRITVPVEQKALDLEVTEPGQVVAARTVRGTLNVDDRDKVSQAEKIHVSAGETTVSASLTGIEVDGVFTLKLIKPLDPGEKVKVEFLPGEQSEALVVPISALFTGADGDTAVVVVKNGVERQVTVTMGADAAGFVEITPAADGSVAEGDQVLVSEPTS